MAPHAARRQALLHDRVGPPIATIRLVEYERLQAWLEASGFEPQAKLIDHMLSVRTDAQKQFLRAAFDNLAAIGPVLRRWQDGGTNTWGLAELALLWDRLAPPTTGPGAIATRDLHRQPADSEFKDDLRQHYLHSDCDALYLLMQCMLPTGPDRLAHLQLRAWVLLNGIEMGMAGTLPDQYLADACNALRKGAYETQGGAWRLALAPLGMQTATHSALTEHIKRFQYAKQPQGSHQEAGRTVRRMARWANGSSQRIEWPAHVDASRRIASLFTPPAPELETPEERIEASAASLPCPVDLDWGQLAGLQSEEADEWVALEVDPDASPESQELWVRSARLQLGAAARFLAWDWPQVLPPERDSLKQLIETELARSTTVQGRLLAALSWLAMHVGLSLEEVLHVPLRSGMNAPTDSDWCVNLTAGCALRRPARRADQARPNDEQRDCLVPVAASLVLNLPSPVADALRAATSRRTDASVIGHLWDSSSRRAASAFRHWVQSDPSTRRIQPAMLGRVLGQFAYEASRDHVLARILPSTPDAALPASTYYTAFHRSDLSPVWNGIAVEPGYATVDLNVGGSLLDPNGDEQFSDGFNRARRRIGELDVDRDWLALHNAVTLYWDAALRAATGVRPVNDLWMDPRHFNWDEGLVFVDDKASPVAASGRLIPLPGSLSTSLRSRYLTGHLPWIRDQLRREECDVSDLPFLFLLNHSKGRLQVGPVTNDRRRETGIETPLPLNVFRHRLRTRLHAMHAVDKEVVDSILGHGDGATLTHGDYSMRVWRQDANAIRPALEDAFSLLGVAPPLPRTPLPPPESHEVEMQTGSKPALPPTRQDRRRRGPGWRLRHAREAIELIRLYLNNTEVTADGQLPNAPPMAEESRSPRPLDALLKRLATLPGDGLDELSRRLLRRDDGLPETTGPLRYAFFLRLCEAAADRHGLRPALRRRYDTRGLEDSPFLAEAATALQGVARLKAALDEHFDALAAHARLSLGDSLLLLTLDLCVTSRIAHRPLLDSLLDTPDRWRIVRLESRFHLEWSPDANLRAEHDAACMRFAISARAAWLLTTMVQPRGRRRSVWARPLPLASQLASALWGGVSGAIEVHNSELIEHVATLVDQANLIELPGTLAGHLGGRVWSASLGWGEWLRVRQGRWTDPVTVAMPYVSETHQETIADGDTPAAKVPRYADLDDEDDSDIVGLTRATKYRGGEAGEQVPSERAILTHLLVQEVQRGIRSLRETKGLTKRRQARAVKLARVVHEQSSQVSSTIRLLCLWAIDMLIRPGRSRKLATSSVERYFVALSPRFKSLGADLELEAMDDEQIEGFYCDVIERSPVKNLADVRAGLRSFHRFAHANASLPEIDWSAITSAQELIFGAPGFVDESTYLRCVDFLGADLGFAPARPWQLQCFLILAYRFGLRGGECAGLSRADVVWDKDTTVSHVLVRRNRQRSLKTTAARRVVPRLFVLSPSECEALHSLKHSMLPVSGVEDTQLPLLSAMERPESPIPDIAVRQHLNGVLQRCTGQPGSTLHDLRHSFAAHAWAAMQSTGWAVLGRVAPVQDERKVQQRVLGVSSNAPSRRSPWALARLMGHAHPRSAMLSYVHCLGDALATKIDVTVPSPKGLDPLSIACVVLDDAADHAFDAAPAPAVEPLPLERQATAALSALRHLAAGRSVDEIQRYSELTGRQVSYLMAVSDAVLSALTASKRSGLDKHLSEPGSARLTDKGLLAFVRASAFGRLRDGLAGLPVADLSKLRALDIIDPEQWGGMVGPRREISLWTRGQFELIGTAIRRLSPSTRELELQVPVSTSADVSAQDALANLARLTGWLPTPSGNGAVHDERALCESLTPTKALPAVRLASSGVRIDRRAVLAFSTPPGGAVNDRLELLVATMCLGALAVKA